MAVTELSDALALHSAGKLAEAALRYDAVLATDPDNPDILYNAGLCRLQMGALDAGIACMTRLLAVRPDDTAAHQALGKAYRLQRDDRKAETHLVRALQLEPRLGDSALELASLLEAQNRLVEASNVLADAIGRTPGDPRLYTNIGNLMRRAGFSGKAEEAWQQAIRVDPSAVQARCNLALHLTEHGRQDDALALAEEAVALAPRLSETHYMVGVVQTSRGRHPEAARAWAEALRLDPSSRKTAVRLAKARQALCDWDGLDELMPAVEAEMARAVAGGTTEVSPFFALTLPIGEAERKAVAASWASSFSRTASPLRKKFATRKPKTGSPARLHIGYISSDWADTPVGHLTSHLFAQHDRDRFEVTVFSTGPEDHGPTRRLIEQGSDRFVDCFSMDDLVAAQKIHDLGIDILIDVQGFSGVPRAGIMALRPAPVQVLFLAVCGTTGSDWIDYIVADRIVLPEAAWPNYSEAPLLMPDCFMAANDHMNASERPASRAEQGLPETGVVFCSFSNRYKITRQIFAVWMRILNAVSGSVLWIPGGPSEMTDRLRAAASAVGIDPDRIVFSRYAETKEDHLARLQLADLFLDTPNYGAHSSGLDSLWAGVPMLGLMGDGFPARVGASMLGQLGLDELIADNIADYERMAIRLGNDPAELASLRDRLAAVRGTSPLFDSARWVENIEQGYRAIWQNYLDGQPPQPIYL